MSTPKVEDLLPKTEFEKPRAPQGMRLGTIYRQNDETGVSGKGIIAQVCLFADGQASVQWICPPAAGDIVTKRWDSWLDVHVRQHPKNGTIITWSDGSQEIFDPVPKAEDGNEFNT